MGERPPTAGEPSRKVAEGTDGAPCEHPCMDDEHRAEHTFGMRPSSHFLSCDWGTSSFRLRLVDRTSLSVLAAVQHSEGVKSIHARLVEGGRSGMACARDIEFRQVLGRALGEIAVAHSEACRDAPIVISGMASSTVGWRVVPYAAAPCGLDGSGLGVDELTPFSEESTGSAHRIWLVSGLSTGGDIMRGEECEILGILALPEYAGLHGDSLLVLPGTHSKHVRVREGSLADFRTFMTGELLEMLSSQSLLAVSVAWPPPEVEVSPAHELHFEAGARAAREGGLARGLFQVRVNSVLRETPAGPNSLFLAGLLIGAEVLDLATWNTAAPILLAGARHFAPGYRRALEILGFGPRLRVATPEQMLNATLRSHELVLRRVESGP